MYPVLFTVFGFEIHSFGVMILIAFLAALWFARRRAPRYGLAPEDVNDVGFWALLAGIFGARIAFILTELPHFIANPHDLLRWQFQGLTSFGGIIGGALAVILWCRIRRKPVTAMIDVAAPPLLLGHAIGRVGCLLNGCCYGGACDLPWGIAVANEPGLYHPAQIYDSLLNLLAMAFLLRVEVTRKLAPGQVAALFFVLHGVARFVYEFWRAGTTSEYLGPLPITMAQAMALVLAMFGAALFGIFGRRAAGEVVAT
ncbi:MAG TPA: prolipoprotein diacylglyceryl transferase [Fimbriimonadaceae bacterium]|nr:prolipoprotein diacylglyceryl transferase [Fimbriimonadaceae bacterium]